MPATPPTWNSIAARVVEQAKKVSGLLRDFGPELRQPGMAAAGERSLSVGRPYTFLPASVLQALDAAAEMAPWPALLQSTASHSQRVGIIRNCFDKAVVEAWERDQAAAYLTNRVDRIARLRAMYEFIFPLNNVEIQQDFRLSI